MARVRFNLGDGITIVLYNGDKERDYFFSYSYFFGCINIGYRFKFTVPVMPWDIQIVVTLIKYIPQVYLNYKSVLVGWTIHNVLLDFTGGVCSVVQLFIDAGSWAIVIAISLSLALV